MQLMRAPTSIAHPNNRPIVVPGTGKSYALDGKGCVLVQQFDLPWFISQGYSAPRT